MRKWLVLMLVIFGAAAYSLEAKLDFLPAVAQTGEHTDLKSLEHKLAEHFQNHEEHFTVSYKGNKDELAERMSDVIRASLRHDDYSAYILKSYVYTIRSRGDQSTVSLDVNYRETKEQTAFVDKQVKQTIAEIVKPSMNDHEKVKAIHDWVVTVVEYDQSLSYYTAYEALQHGLAVCQGYSLLTYKLMKEAGIPVLIAEGAVDTGEHAWNMVQLDGVWYHIDTTWDDPVVKSGDGEAVDRKSKPIRYNYYLKTDAELAVDHTWTREYPAASTSYAAAIGELSRSTDGDEAERFDRLKRQIGLHWLEDENTVANAEELRTLIQAAISKRTTSLQFRYVPGEQGFPETLRSAFEGTYIAVGYRVGYEEYSNDGALLVNIQLEYRA